MIFLNPPLYPRSARAAGRLTLPAPSHSLPRERGRVGVGTGGRRGAWITELQRLRRSVVYFAAAVFAAPTALSSAAGADTAPRRGGTLEFAVLVEPGNYD